jgi:hypothetical protein
MIFLIPVIFIINPFMGTTLFGIYLSAKRSVDNKMYYMFYFVLAAFLGFINMTKVPFSDLAYHAGQYLHVKNLNLLQYLAWQGREFVFYTFNYVVFHITGGSVKYWIFIITFISYFPFFIAIHKFHAKINPNPSYILFAITIAAFFPQLFSLSAHLVRQFMAGSVFIYFTVEKLIFNKHKWWLAILGIFIHSSSIILFLLAYIWFLKDRITKKNIGLYVGLFACLILYQLIAQTLLSSVSESQSLSYALSRASSNTKFELQGFAATNYIFIVVLMYVIFKNVFVDKLQSRIPGVEHFSKIFIILTFFILININQSELSVRLFFYLCFCFPFIMPLALQGEKYNGIRKFISISVIIFFIIRLSTGMWQYDSIFSLISSSVFSFLGRKEFAI